MGLIKSIKEMLLPKKRVPIKVKYDFYDVQRDEYLLDLLNRLEKLGKSLDSDTQDTV